MYPAGILDDPNRTYLIAELPDRERPRERLLRHGAGVLSDTELLAIILRSGPRGRSVLDLARDLVSTFDGDLRKLSGASISELCQVRGIGPAKAVEMHAAFALAHRLHVAQLGDRPKLASPGDVAALLRETFRQAEQEQFHVLLLDTKHFLIRDECVTIGLVDRSHVHAREVFRSAIRESCSRVILAHNHPSGDPTPSAQDVSCTRDLVAAGKIIGIEVLDHIVMGRATASRPRDHLSFREENLLA